MELHKAEALALELMKQHGLTNPQKWIRPWHFEFDNAVRRFGVCKYRSFTIGLSAPLVRRNTEEQVKDTILHEIAHALAGSNAGHGPLWKLQCLAIGAKPERCYSSDEVEGVKGKWSATCRGCNHTYYKHRRPKHYATYSCPPCRRSYSKRHLAQLTWQGPGCAPVKTVILPPVEGQRFAVAAQVPVAPVVAQPVAPPVNVMLPSNSAAFSVQRCVELYTGGVTKLIDLAEQMGYPRGHGQTRCKRVLVKAGVFNAELSSR